MAKIKQKLSKAERVLKVVEGAHKRETEQKPTVSPAEAAKAPLVPENNGAPAPDNSSGDQKSPPSGDQKATLPKKKVSDVVAKWRAQKAFDPKQVIRLLRQDNPKRRGAGTRFSYYKDGMSVQDYIDIMKEQNRTPKQTMDDMRWDHAAEFIKVE